MLLDWASCHNFFDRFERWSLTGSSFAVGCCHFGICCENSLNDDFFDGMLEGGGVNPFLSQQPHRRTQRSFVSYIVTSYRLIDNKIGRASIDGIISEVHLLIAKVVGGRLGIG